MLRESCKECKWFKKGDPLAVVPEHQVDYCDNSNWKTKGYYLASDSADVKCPHFRELNNKRYDVGVMEPAPLPKFSTRRETMLVEGKKKEKEDKGKKDKKWIQKAVDPKDKGKFTDWCKKRGYKSVTQTCINEAISAGGKAAQMANFAISVSKGKYKHPKKKKKKAELLGQLVRLADVLDEQGLKEEVTQLDTVIKEVSEDTSYESTGEPVAMEEFTDQILGE